MAEWSFFSEMRKRKVVHVAAIYGAVAWGVTEVVVTIVEQLFLPQLVATFTVIGFVVGFPVAMFLAWTFDITADGIVRTSLASRRGKASIVFSLALLVAGTAGLFFLIRPALQQHEAAKSPADILPNSIAVMPCENAGLDPGDSYLSEGLSDQLRDQLARVVGIRIAARSSSRVAVERGLGALEAATKLGVANIVECSIRRQGNRLRISVQMIEGASGLVVWSKVFEPGPRELLAVQQAIAEQVVARLLPDADAVTEPATRNATANELMLLARHYDQQVRDRPEVDEATLREAIRLYREATEADPESALAQSRLAGSLIYMGGLDAAEAPIFKALSINPNLSEVQNTLGEFYFARGLTKEASIAWARAVELNPNNPQALQNYARWRWRQHEFEGAHEMYRHAVELDPLSLEPYAALGAFLALESRYDEAYQLLVRVEELFDGAPAYRIIADIYEYLGDVDLSIAWTIRARELEPRNPNHVAKLAELFADIGDHETALRLDPNGIGILFKARRFEEMIDIAEFAMIDQPQDLQLRAILAVAYNATGQYDSAIYVLSTTGLPDSVLNGWRSRAEMTGYGALKNALYAIGDVEAARKLARFAVEELRYTDGNEWWQTITKACELAVLGDDEGTRNSLKRAQKGLHLVWDPVLKDAPCFDRFADDPVYQAVIRHYDERRAMLRERLPATLAEFGVEL